MGGSVVSLDFMQKEIEESASSYHERYKSGQDVIVGVNKFVTDTIDDVDILKVDPEAERAPGGAAEEAQGIARPGRRRRPPRRAHARSPTGDGNLLPPMKEALRAGASIGEVSGALRDVFGEYQGGAFF